MATAGTGGGRRAAVAYWRLHRRVEGLVWCNGDWRPSNENACHRLRGLGNAQRADQPSSKMPSPRSTGCQSVRCIRVGKIGFSRIA